MHEAIDRILPQVHRSLSKGKKMQTPTTMPHPIANEDLSPRALAMQALADDVFAQLTAAGIPYCILRNRDAIPHGLVGWLDIDVLLPGEMTINRLASVFATLKPAQIGRLRRGPVSFFFPANDVYLRVDIFYGDIKWKSADFVDHKQILANRWNDRGYMVAAPLHQAYIVWFSKLLSEGSLPAHYETMICEAVQHDPRAFHNLIESAFGKELAVQLVDLAMTRRLAESTHLVSACRRALWLNELRRHPLATPLAFANQIRHGLAERLAPSGLDVAFLGPDGAGKTTISTQIAQSPLRRVAFKKVHTRLGYRQTLPPLRTIASIILRRPVLPDSTHLDPHGAPPHRLLMWLLKFGYYSIDQWLEQIWLRREMAHSSLILKDRHLMELPIDPMRYRFSGPTVLTRWMARLVPKPTLVIVLDTPTEVLQARKQEVSLEETARQRRAYRHLAKSVPHGYLVNSDRPLDDVIHDVLEIINEFATMRTKKRFYRHGGDTRRSPNTRFPRLFR